MSEPHLNHYPITRLLIKTLVILRRKIITSKNYFPCLLLARGTRLVQVRQNSLEKLRLTAENSLEKLRWVFEKSLKKVYFCFQIKCHTMRQHPVVHRRNARHRQARKSRRLQSNDKNRITEYTNKYYA